MLDIELYDAKIGKARDYLRYGLGNKDNYHAALTLYRAARDMLIRNEKEKGE